MIKAVLFDIDGVLLDSFEANLKFFQDLMVKAGYKPPTRLSYPAVFHLTMYDAIRALTQSDSEEEIKQIWELGRNRTVRYPAELLTLPPNAEKVLQILSNKYLLGIVTSRVKETVFESPQLGILQGYFQAVASYYDTEKHKPDPEPLLFGANLLKVSPQECVYVGDVQNDIIAAKAAGMKVIIYSKDQFLDADATTSEFIDIPTLVATL